jgi:hypothetical protein
MTRERASIPVVDRRDSSCSHCGWSKAYAWAANMAGRFLTSPSMSPANAYGFYIVGYKPSPTLGIVVVAVVLGTRGYFGEDVFNAWAWRVPFPVSFLPCNWALSAVVAGVARQAITSGAKAANLAAAGLRAEASAPRSRCRNPRQRIDRCPQQAVTAASLSVPLLVKPLFGRSPRSAMATRSVSRTPSPSVSAKCLRLNVPLLRMLLSPPVNCTKPVMVSLLMTCGSPAIARSDSAPRLPLLISVATPPGEFRKTPVACKP